MATDRSNQQWPGETPSDWENINVSSPVGRAEIITLRIIIIHHIVAVAFSEFCCNLHPISGIS